MTLLYIDGFAHNNTGRYSNPKFNTFGQTSTPRVAGSYYVSLEDTSAGDTKRLVTASAEIFTGIGFRPAVNNVGLLAFWGDSGAAQHMTLFLNSSGKLEAKRGSHSGTVVATGDTTVNTSQWRYIEIRCVVDDTNGIFQVRLDGSSTNEIDFAGDTRNAGTSTNIDAVSFRSYSGSSHFVCDWYIVNTGDVPSGTPCKTWLGDVSVRALVPSGNGASSGLTGSDSNQTDNYLLVDEVPPSSTDYTGAAVGGGLKDTYTLADLPGSVTAVLGVQVSASMAKSDAGEGTAQVVTRVGGTDYNPDTATLTTSYAETAKLWTADPAGSAWTTSAVNAMEIGVLVP